VAQKLFRDRQAAQFKEMKEKMAVFEELEEKEKQLEEKAAQANTLALTAFEECSSLQLEIESLKVEREQMIHIMDRLRSDNSFLCEERDRQRRAENFNQNPTIRKSHNVLQSGFVKGNFGCIARPPLVHTVRKVASMPWTSHKNTFVDSCSSSDPDSNSQSQKGGNPIHSSVQTHTSSEGTSTHIQSLMSLAKDNNNYPGFPAWTPPNLQWVPQEHLGSRKQSASNLTRKLKNFQPPNPIPYHLSFSYADSKQLHTTSTISNTNSNTNIFMDPLFPPLVSNGSLFPTANLFSLNASQAQMPQNNFSQSLFEDDKNIWMPFLPSTNAMVPLYHHMPFEGLTMPDIARPIANSAIVFDSYDQFVFQGLGSQQVDAPIGDLSNVFLPTL
jgi:hypothetical protein